MNNIYFIDSNTPDIQTLIAGLPTNATPVILQADKNGLEQIVAYLQTNNIRNLDAIHLFSHASAGELYLGNSNVTAATLNQNADLLAKIGQSLSTTGDILLYGCDAAQGDIGQNFVNTLANLTGADVAASNDLTGAANLGGDWDLEFQHGNIEANTVTNANYDDVLAVTAGSITSITTDSGTAGDFITNDTTLTFGGNYTKSSTGTLYLYDGSTQLGSVSYNMMASNSGTWSISYATALAAGSHTITTKATTTGTALATQIVTIDTTAPTLTTLAVQIAANATQVVYRATFGEAISGLTKTNFSASGSTATVATVASVGTAVNGGYTTWDITVSGGNFGAFSGSEVLSFANTTSVTDVAGNSFTATPSTTATAVVSNATATPVTLTSFSAITGGNEDTEQTITFANLTAAGDEASTAGAINAFVIKTVSTGTLKIGTSSATATAFVTGTNDVVNVSNNLYWIPAANANGTLNAFTAIAKESGGQTSPYEVQATITVSNVNDAPVLNIAASPAFTGTYNGSAPSGAVGALVSSLVDFATPSGQVDNITDVDSGAALGIAITATDTNGTWYYSTNAGSTWTAVGTVSDTSALLLAADANTRVYFQPTSGFIGSANFTFKAWDQTSGSNGSKAYTSLDSAFSIATDTVAVTVAPSGLYGLFADTSATDTFTDATGNLVGTGTDTITGGSTGSWSVSGTTYTDQKVGTYGTLYVKDGSAGMSMMASATGGTYRYVPNATAVNALSSGSITETYTITDSTTETINIYIQGANDAPVLDNTKSPILTGQTGNASTPTAPIGAMGSLVSSLVDFSTVAGGFDNVSDVDTGAILGIALTAVNSTNGNWYFSTDGGSTWATVGAVTNTNALLLAADANTRLYFSSNQDYFGTVSNAITFKAWDQSTGTAGNYLTTATGSQFSTATDTASIKIANPNNHAPTFDNPAVTVSYADTSTTDTFTNQTGILSSSDADSDPVTFSISAGILGSTTINSIVYDISSASAYGTLYVKSTTGDYVFVPTSTAIDALSTATTATFTVLADDGQTTTPQTLTLDLTGVNDRPVLDASKSPTFAGNYNASSPTGLVGTLVSSLVDFATPLGQVDNVTDTDSGALLGIAITATDTTNGTWYYSTNAGSTWATVGTVSATSALLLDANARVYFKANTSYVGSANLTIKAWDTTSGTAGTKVNPSTNSAFSTATDDVIVSVAPTGIYTIYTDTSSSVETFADWVGTSALTAGSDTIQGGSSGTWTISGTTYTDMKAGNYGTLYVKDGAGTSMMGMASATSGSYRYVPDAIKINALGAEQTDTDVFSVDWSVTASMMGSNSNGTNVLNVYVSGANDVPTITAPNLTTFTDTATSNNFSNQTGTIVATDVENQTITYGIKGGTVSGAISTFTTPYGVATINTTSGAYTFTPDDAAINALSANTSYNGIIFTATDSGGAVGESAGWAITLNAVNDTPIISAKTITGLIDTIAPDTFTNKTDSISATDAEGTALIYSLTRSSAVSFTAGAITYNLKTTGNYGDFYIKSSTGEYVYVPDNAKVNAISSDQTDVFTVSSSDGSLSASNTVTINLSGTNDNPILATPTAIALVDTTAADVFGVQTENLSATDADTGTTLTYGISGITASGSTVTKMGTYGTLVLTTSSGAYTYTPNAAAINAISANQTDTFTVTASDGSLTDTKNLIVNVTGANDVPIITSGGTGTVAENESISTVIYTTVATDIDAGDTRTYSLKAATGDVSLLDIDATTGEVTLKTSADFETNKTYNFTVVATDANGLTAEKAIIVGVTDVNEVPKLTGTIATLSSGTEDTAYTISKTDLLQGYSDPENAAMSITNLTAVEHGNLVQSGSNWIFTPDANYNGDVNLTYKISDGTLSTGTINQSFTLAAVNDAPVLTGTKAILTNGSQGVAYNITTADLIKGYTDVDGDTLSASNLSANHGTFAANGSDWTFTPTPNYGGAVTFAYNVIDGHGGSVAVNQSFSLITPTLAQGAQTDIAFSYNAKSAFSTPATNATYSVGSLPNWLTFNPSTGAFTGTPHLVDLGTTIVSITKKVGTVNSTVNLSLVVEPFKIGNVQVSADATTSIVGGTGIDTVSYYYSPNAVTVTLPNANAGTGKLAQVENLVGSQFDDSLTGNIFANVLDGRAGTNTLIGGAGNDIYIVQNINDKIIELAKAGMGMDTVYTAVDSYPLPDNVENIILLGSDNLIAIGNCLSNKITGNAGNNKIIGNGGGDWLLGGKGDDTYIITNPANSVALPVTIEEAKNEGIDSVEINTAYTLPANVENLKLTDAIFPKNGTANFNGVGNDLNNIVIGNSGNNALYGMNGNDWLDGGLGKDTLTGGTGTDVFKFSTTPNTTNIDTITDFVSGTDKIHLSKTIFTALSVIGNLPANEIGNHVIYNKNTGVLSYDADGSLGAGVAVQIALVANHSLVLNTDFSVIA